jgi:protein-S-isoprenylcysteine O-methyltransferase Ste14
MKKKKLKKVVKDIAAHSSIVVFFIMAFEVMIMISPFAFFFYSVFNPIFKWLDHYTATKWLTAFFFPHMILPPTLFLKSIRILGSVFFIVGALTFITCALQVYLGKICRWGIAHKGLYQYIRHPQYFALGTWGIGLCILWPRFIVLVILSTMFFLYYLLARDEERRMVNQYGDNYTQYMHNTGMFFPRFIERKFSFMDRMIPRNSVGYMIIFILLTTVVVGAGFISRGLTLRSLSFETEKNLTLVSILPEDKGLCANVLRSIFRSHSNGAIDFLKDENDYVGYLMQPDYIMQGMIANTGGEFHLYKKHHTIAMITDWVLHPFQHLRRPPSVHMAKLHNVDPTIMRKRHCPVGIDEAEMKCETCPYKRVIIVEMKHNYGEHLSKDKLFSFNTTRIPVGFIDINTQSGEIRNIRRVSRATAWGDVPTPAI